MTKFTVSKNLKPSTTSKKVRMMVKKVHQKSYCQYDSGHLFNSLIEFACCTDGTFNRDFVKSKEKISKSSFLHYFFSIDENPEASTPHAVGFYAVFVRFQDPPWPSETRLILRALPTFPSSVTPVTLGHNAVIYLQHLQNNQTIFPMLAPVIPYVPPKCPHHSVVWSRSGSYGCK